jgi:hypothetical protein
MKSSVRFSNLNWSLDRPKASVAALKRSQGASPNSKWAVAWRLIRHTIPTAPERQSLLHSWLAGTSGAVFDAWNLPIDLL